MTLGGAWIREKVSAANMVGISPVTTVWTLGLRPPAPPTELTTAQLTWRTGSPADADFYGDALPFSGAEVVISWTDPNAYYARVIDYRIWWDQGA